MRLPVIATTVVAVAVATMIGLGIWQLQRAEWKKGLLARYEQAGKLPPVAWPAVPDKREDYYFRRATGFCLEVVGWRAVAGRNVRDEPGQAHIAQCRTGAEGPGMQVDIGWSLSSEAPGWKGGPVTGTIAPDSKYGIRLVSAGPAPGLEQSAPPSIEAIPNNHLLYAFQWFAFAAIAAIIYVLALRKRMRETPGG
jgi:cytochrome oxidase assembly protein ShyY1